MKNWYKIVSFIFLSAVLCSGEVAISRAYDVNNSAISNQDNFLLEGFISFQACDTMACIPITQEVIHEAKKTNSSIIFTQNHPNVLSPPGAARAFAS